MLLRMRQWLGWGGLAAGVIVVALWALGNGGPRPGSVKPFAVQGLRMDVPAEWTINATGWPSSGLGSTWAVIGTLPWGPCLPFDLNCHDQQRLSAGQIEVAVGMVGAMMDFCAVGATRSDLADRGPGDPVATGSLMRVDGRPTIQTDYTVARLDFYRSDEWRTWRIATAGTTGAAYDIDAKYQGRQVAQFRAQLDAMIASVHIPEAPQAIANGPADCGPPFPP